MRLFQDMRLVLLLFVMTASFLIVFGVDNMCVVPTDGQSYSRSITLCRGNYQLKNGIVLEGEGTVLDCNKSQIKGAYSGSGIRVKGEENSVRNCAVENYESAIVFDGAKRGMVRDSVLSRSVNAVSFVDSYENRVLEVATIDNIQAVNVVNSKFNVLRFLNKSVANQRYCIDNACDIDSINPCVNGDGYCGSKCTTSEDSDCTGQISVDETVGMYKLVVKDALIHYSPSREEQINKIIDAGRVMLNNTIDQASKQRILARFNLSDAKYKEALDSVKITKYAYISGNKTLFEITVIAKKPVQNLVLYEYFPEQFDELRTDKLEWTIGSIEVGGNATVNYEAEQDALLKENPVTIPYLGDVPKDSWWGWVIGYVLAGLGIQYRRFRAKK